MSHDAIMASHQVACDIMMGPMRHEEMSRHHMWHLPLPQMSYVTSCDMTFMSYRCCFSPSKLFMKSLCHGAFGLFRSHSEWKAISSGRLLPKESHSKLKDITKESKPTGKPFRVAKTRPFKQPLPTISTPRGWV